MFLLKMVAATDPSLPNPDALDKFLYVRRTPSWLVRGVYAFGLFSWALVLYAYANAALYDPFYRYFAAPIVLLLTVYVVLSYVLMLLYRQFDVDAHAKLVQRYWSAAKAHPRIDVFLPICGEEFAILRNTSQHVARLDYDNFHVYVLDDFKENQTAHQRLAQQLGFTYFERPNKGELKKAGNLKYGYERTDGEFVLVFDADFAPRTDFVEELLPYMSDDRAGIVQSPQYFETRHPGMRLTPWEYFGARGQEVFYRFAQPSRDRFSGAVCCGSNAIYRRAAMNTIGGSVVQVEYGEDTRTAMALMMKGWRVKYVPVILAIGLSPDNAHAFFHQQHRWCMSSMHQVLSAEFWQSRSLTWQQKWCYLTGYTFYLHHPIIILFSFQLFWSFFVYNRYITLAGSAVFLPYMLFCLILLPSIIIQRFRFRSLYGYMLLSYASSHA